jgi:hypothetical protein
MKNKRINALDFTYGAQFNLSFKNRRSAKNICVHIAGFSA